MATRLLTLGMRRYLTTQPRTKRMKKAAQYIRERVAHYTKTSIENVKFGKELDAVILSTAKHMKPVRLSVELDKGKATVKPFRDVEAKPEAKAAKADTKAEGKTKAESAAKEAATEAPKEEQQAKPKAAPARSKKKEAPAEAEKTTQTHAEAK